MKKAPKFLKEYFWDIDFEKLDIENHHFYVITRILNYGDKKAIQWMNRHFDKSEQIQTLCVRRDMSLQSANFWALVLGVPQERVKCLQKPYLKMRRQHWHY